MTQSTLTVTKDAVASGATGAVGVTKGALQTGIDTAKTVVTGTKDVVSTGLTGAVNMAKGTVQTGMDTTKTVLTGTKDTVSTGLTGAMGVAKGAQAGIKIARKNISNLRYTNDTTLMAESEEELKKLLRKVKKLA